MIASQSLVIYCRKAIELVSLIQIGYTALQELGNCKNTLKRLRVGK